MLGFHALLLVVHGLEVDFRHVHRRKAAARHHIRDRLAHVRIENVRAGNAKERSEVGLGNVLQREDAGLRGLLRAADPDGTFCYTFFKAVAVVPAV